MHISQGGKLKLYCKIRTAKITITDIIKLIRNMFLKLNFILRK